MVGLLNRLIRGAAARTRLAPPPEGPVRLPANLARLGEGRRRRLEELVILGVLLNRVAHADAALSDEEERALQKILQDRGAHGAEAALVAAAAREAAERRPDLQGFTREINKRPYKERLEVVELLFRLAYADRALSLVELESVREIAGLFWISHKDFIAAKLRVRRELGL